MKAAINLAKIILLLALFPLLLLATCYLTVMACGYLLALLAIALDTTFLIPLPLTASDVLPQFMWQVFNITPPHYSRPALLVPASAAQLWAQFSPLAERATLAAAPYVLGFALLWLFWGFRNSQRLIAQLTDARGLAYSECPPLYDALEKVCARAAMPMPQLYLVRKAGANAFAAGLGPSTYSISVTAGLLALLDREELEAVLAHELSHIRHQDVRLFVVASVMVGLFQWLGSIMLTMVVHTMMGYNSHYRRHVLLLPLVLALALPVLIGAILSVLLKLLFMREREIAADAGAAALTSASAMASALQALAEDRGGLHLPKALRDMVIYRAEPKRTWLGRAWRRLWSTHPSYSTRLQALAVLGARPRSRGPALFRLQLPESADSKG